VCDWISWHTISTWKATLHTDSVILSVVKDLGIAGEFSSDALRISRSVAGCFASLSMTKADYPATKFSRADFRLTSVARGVDNRRRAITVRQVD